MSLPLAALCSHFCYLSGTVFKFLISTVSELATCTLKMGSYTDTSVVAHNTSLNQLAALTFLFCRHLVI